MDLLSLLNSQLQDQDVVKKISKQVGAKPDQVKQLTELALPTLLQAMNKNTQTQDGAKSLLKALDQHQDDDVSDLNQFFNKVDKQDGAKILGHLLGNKESRVEQGLAAKTGMDMSQVSSLLMMLAPLLLGQLGKHKKQQNDFGIDDLMGMLGGSNKGSNDVMCMVSGLLDSDGDGDIMDDVSKLFGGFLKK